MADRRMMMKDFLERSGWGNARLDDLAGDASNRRYFRVNKANDHAVLMDAPPEKGEDVGPFVQIAKVLRAVPL
ncbi:MAG: aminoglycoside phosphotransferase, partial [Pseudomonadota bacterium]